MLPSTKVADECATEEEPFHTTNPVFCHFLYVLMDKSFIKVGILIS